MKAFEKLLFIYFLLLIAVSHVALHNCGKVAGEAEKCPGEMKLPINLFETLMAKVPLVNSGSEFVLKNLMPSNTIQYFAFCGVLASIAENLLIGYYIATLPLKLVNYLMKNSMKIVFNVLAAMAIVHLIMVIWEVRLEEYSSLLNSTMNFISSAVNELGNSDI
jgi:hypothetical protein